MRFKSFVIVGFLFLMSVTQASAEFSSEIVAKVGKDVVTSRKIQAEIIIKNFWKDQAGNYKFVPTHTEQFSNALDEFLIERIVYLESKSFSITQFGDKELALTKALILKRIKKNSQAQQEWQALQLSDSEVDSMIRQKIAAQKFIEFKEKSSFVPVTDAEALNYYHNNKKDFGGKDYSAVKEVIKKNLAKEQAEQRLMDWYDILRKKYDVMKVITVNN